MYGGSYHPAWMHATPALSAVSSARERLREERTAFGEFGRQVADLEPSPAPASSVADGASGVVAVHAGPADGPLQRVRRCYRETVLAARGDDEDRQLVDHLAADFGRETAMAVGNGVALSTPLKQSLVHGARRANKRRSRAETTLDREEMALERVRTLTTAARDPIAATEHSLIDRDFDALFDLYRSLSRFESRFESLLEERQNGLRSENSRHQDPAALRSEIYRPLPVSHPVLADGAALVRDLRDARERVTRALARRD